MLKQFILNLSFVSLVILSACGNTSPPNPTPPPLPTVQPTLSIAEIAPTLTLMADVSTTPLVTCQDIEAYWGNDWARFA